MIDLRHHIYSLVAVFLALAVGVVIGSSFTGTSPVEQQSGKLTRMERMVRRVESDFAFVRAEIVQKQDTINKLQQKIERNETFSRTALPLILKDRLAWRNVAIVQTGDYDITGQIKTSLEQAGARVTSVTRIAKPSLFDNPNLLDATMAKLGLEAGSQDEHKSTPVFRAISTALVSARNTEILTAMEENKIITRSGDYSRWNKLVVIIGGGARASVNFSEQVDTPLIEELQKSGIAVVGCEPEDAVESYMKTYRKSGISTVDNADRSSGQVALVYALAGESGHFGVKSTAERFLPAGIEGQGK